MTGYSEVSINRGHDHIRSESEAIKVIDKVDSIAVPSRA
jgi:hypothetical protein